MDFNMPNHDTQDVTLIRQACGPQGESLYALFRAGVVGYIRYIRHSEVCCCCASALYWIHL